MLIEFVESKPDLQVGKRYRTSPHAEVLVSCDIIRIIDIRLDEIIYRYDDEVVDMPPRTLKQIQRDILFPALED